MDDLPDFYADNVNLGISEFSVTLTLQLSIPDPDTGTGRNVSVVRVRLSPPLAKKVAEMIQAGLQQAALANTQQQTTIKQ